MSSVEARIETAGNVLDRLAERGWEFDFFQAVWLLERFFVDGEPVGFRGPTARELLRFRPDVSLAFPPTDVRRITPSVGADGRPPRFTVEVTFLGLYGVSTPLPLHYAVDVLRSLEPVATAETTRQEAARAALDTVEAANVAAAASATGLPSPAKRPSRELRPLVESSPLRDFLDVIHHRVISLFYRAWTKYRYEKAFGLPHRDELSGYLKQFIGLLKTDGAESAGLPSLRLLRYAGLWTQHPKTAAGLEALLGDFWEGIGIRVVPLRGRWILIAVADQNRLGRANSRLGMDMTLGEQVYDLAGEFRILVGPVDWETYLTFLPDGWRHQQTHALTRLYCADPLSFTMEVSVLPNEVPELRLSQEETAGRLGYTSWARTAPLGQALVVFEKG